MRTTLALVLCGVAALLLVPAISAAHPERSDLTGTWSCDDGGTYYVRQIGDQVWWTGQSGEREPRGEKKAFANVFHGTIHGNKITGSWVDDPKGEARGAGALTLEIRGEGKDLRLKKEKEEGSGFGGDEWTPRR